MLHLILEKFTNMTYTIEQINETEFYLVEPVETKKTKKTVDEINSEIETESKNFDEYKRLLDETKAKIQALKDLKQELKDKGLKTKAEALPPVQEII